MTLWKGIVRHLALISLGVVILIVAATSTPHAGTEQAAVPDMSLIPQGDFLMGSDGDAYPTAEKPAHKVHTPAYYIDRYEVSNEKFAEFLNNARLDETKGGKRWQWIVLKNDLETEERFAWYSSEISFRDGKYSPVRGFEKYPVITVSWHAADAYCKANGKRLPTEAEWEKAARGGIERGDYPWGNNFPLPEGGPVFGKKWRDNTMPAPFREGGNYPPNGFGLYDMAGNAAEWCSDWYDEFYYKTSPADRPQGPQKGVRKVVRGGSWASSAVGLRVAVRYSSAAETLSNTTGFRCVRDIEGE